MVQPRMKNQYERKVACFDGQVRFVCSSAANFGSRSNNKAFDKESAMTFAQTVLDNAKDQLGNRLISEGLFRVDIFEVTPGKFVVNEFESLDADVHGTPCDRLGHEAKLRCDLVNYWLKIISTVVNPIVASLLYSNNK